MAVEDGPEHSVTRLNEHGCVYLRHRNDGYDDHEDDEADEVPSHLLPVRDSGGRVGSHGRHVETLVVGLGDDRAALPILDCPEVGASLEKANREGEGLWVTTGGQK